MSEQGSESNLDSVSLSGLLPAPLSDGFDGTMSAELGVAGSSSFKLDALGPMVVNSDGTLSRIANWPNMTDAEQDRTLRVLSARNRIRIANEAKKTTRGLGGNAK